MTYRNPEQAEYERSIFEAFLHAHLSWAAQVRAVFQPDDCFPDVVTEQVDGTIVEWELGEWLKPNQMASAKTREQLETDIMNAIGDQGSNNTRHNLLCVLSPRGDVKRFNQRDAGGIRTEVMRMIEDVDTHWPQNPFWRSPRGYRCTTFDEYPTLKKYIASIRFEPRFVPGERQEWAPYLPWIVTMPWGGSYDSQKALDALACVIENKAGHYGPFGEKDIRLIVFYNRAALYNTPFWSMAYRKFEDVAAFATEKLRAIRVPFKTVYLLNASERELEAFEVYPMLRKCN